MQAGKTVLTTIHQPSSRLFHKFNKLILLGKGSLLYFGKASEAMDYFSSIGCSPLIAMNPAEFLLDLANGNVNDVTIPSELEDKVQIGNSESETTNGKPSPGTIHEVNHWKFNPEIREPFLYKRFLRKYFLSEFLCSIWLKPMNHELQRRRRRSSWLLCPLTKNSSQK